MMFGWGGGKSNSIFYCGNQYKVPVFLAKISLSCLKTIALGSVLPHLLLRGVDRCCCLFISERETNRGVPIIRSYIATLKPTSSK